MPQCTPIQNNKWFEYSEEVLWHFLDRLGQKGPFFPIQGVTRPYFINNHHCSSGIILQTKMWKTEPGKQEDNHACGPGPVTARQICLLPACNGIKHLCDLLEILTTENWGKHWMRGHASDREGAKTLPSRNRHEIWEWFHWMRWLRGRLTRSVGVIPEFFC